MFRKLFKILYVKYDIMILTIIMFIIRRVIERMEGT